MFVFRPPVLVHAALMASLVVGKCSGSLTNGSQPAGTCGDFDFPCSELTSEALWGEKLETQVARLGLAALVGAIIGVQREFGYAVKMTCDTTDSTTGDKHLHRRLKGAAGLRTHMLASIASCLFTIVSQHGFTKSVPYSAGANSGDPARIAAQIVSGVGFLGAGTIIKGNDGQLCGLTTATTIWTSAALGICAGSDSLDDRLCLIAVTIVVACLQVTFLWRFFHFLCSMRRRPRALLFLARECS